MASATPSVATANPPCKNCNQTTEKTKLCYCGSIYICSHNCWKAYCDSDELFASKCKASMHRKKSKEYESQRKSAAAKKREKPRGADGKFKKNPENVTTTDKTPEQKEKDNISSAASKQKDLIKRHLIQYQQLAPDNQICLRELKKRGKAEVWYSTDGYGPLQSRVKSTNTDEGVSEDIEASEEIHVSPSVADNQGGSSSSVEEPPNLEDVQNIVQERKKITVSQYCGICNERIGLPSKRLKCNFKGCTTHSSLHLICVGLYPANDRERIKIQNCYFCRDHRPETAEVIRSEEGSENETEKDNAVPSPNLNKSAAKKGAAAKKATAAKEPQKRKNTSVAASTQSSKKSRKNGGKSLVSKSSTANKSPKSKSSSHTEKSLPSESSMSSPLIPNDQNSHLSLPSASSTMTEPSGITDLTLPSSISPVQEFVTFNLDADSSFASGSSYGQSTSQFSFSNPGERTLTYHQM